MNEIGTGPIPVHSPVSQGFWTETQLKERWQLKDVPSGYLGRYLLFEFRCTNQRAQTTLIKPRQSIQNLVGLGSPAQEPKHESDDSATR
jgi:hypothetical protein